MSTPRGAYRLLLKSFKNIVQSKSKDSELPQKASALFRRLASKEENQSNGMLALAEDYAALMKAVHDHKELLMSYNIAIDRTAEQSQRLRSTADRVGLQLPKVYQDDPLNQ